MSQDVLARIHVDRQKELQSFEAMLAKSGPAHILLIRAGTGMGKSELLGELLFRSPDRARALIDLKQVEYRPEAILDDFITQLGRARFADYLARVDSYATTAPVNVQAEVSNQSALTVSPSPLTLEQMLDRRRILTNLFFQELVATNTDESPTVVMFDTFEVASQDVRDWVAGQVVERTRGYRWLVLVVAGQQVPTIPRDWDGSSLSHEIGNLDCESIADYANKQGLKLDASALKTLCDSSLGYPLLVKTLVANLAREQQSETPGS